MTAKLTIRLDVVDGPAEYFQYAEQTYDSDIEAQTAYQRAVDAAGGLESEVDYPVDGGAGSNSIKH